MRSVYEAQARRLTEEHDRIRDYAGDGFQPRATAISLRDLRFSNYLLPLPGTTDTEIPVFGPHFYIVGLQVLTQYYSVLTLCLENVLGRNSNIIIIIIIIIIIMCYVEAKCSSSDPDSNI